MATRHDDMTEEQLELERAYKRSWDAAQESLADPDCRAWIEDGLAQVDESIAKPITRDEFLAATEPAESE